jgi:hypothetical protein
MAAMKRLIRAPYLTNALLLVIACELFLLPRRREVFTITINQEGGKTAPPAVIRG